MRKVHEKLGIEPACPLDYPPCLGEYLQRKLWKSTLGEFKAYYVDHLDEKIFLKPEDDKKLFTGKVITQGLKEVDQLIEKYGINLPLLLSEVVEWLSEFRCYIVKGEVRSIAHYTFENKITMVDEEIIKKAA